MTSAYGVSVPSLMAHLLLQVTSKESPRSVTSNHSQAPVALKMCFIAKLDAKTATTNGQKRLVEENWTMEATSIAAVPMMTILR